MAVVVVGVAPHQGGMESIPQGKEPQVLSFQTMCVQRRETSWLTHIENWNISVGHGGDGMALASRMQRGVACPVLRALDGDVPQ